MLDEQNSELKSSLKDKNKKKQSDSKDRLELAFPDNSGRGLLEVNETKFYSMVDTTLEVSQKQAVITAKAANVMEKAIPHMYIYIEYFAAPEQTKPTMFVTELEKRGNSSTLQIQVDEILVNENSEKIDQLKQEINQLEQKINQLQGQHNQIEKRLTQEKELYEKTLSKNPEQTQRSPQKLNQLVRLEKKIIAKLQEKINQMHKLEEKKDQIEREEQTRPEFQHFRGSRTVKSWKIDTVDAIKAVNKAYQVQKEVQNQKYKYTFSGGRLSLSLFSRKKLMNCARYGRKILKAAGVETPSFLFYLRPRDLAPLLRH